MTEEEGQATFKDVLDGQTLHEQVDENTGMSPQVIIESPDEKKQPRIEVRDEKGKILRKYLLPSGAHLMVEDGQAVSAGDVLAKSRARRPRRRTSRAVSRIRPCPGRSSGRLGVLASTRPCSPDTASAPD